MTNEQLAVACVATYCRPLGLSGLLKSLAMAEIPPGWRFHVVVVDNDVEGSAQQTLDVLGDLGIDITSAVEPRQGIPFARNRTVELAMSLGADLLVFVDDDEWVDKRWLLEFAEALHTYEAPVVMGHVLAEFEQPPPSWATETKAFQRRSRPAGTTLDFAITANVLVRSPILDGDTRPFDESLRFSGGEDLELFQRLTRAGHKIVFAPEALTHELIPASRVTKSWVLKRQFRRGTNRSVVLRKHNFRPKQVVKRAVAGIVAIGQGCLIWLSGIVTGETVRLRGGMRVAYGLGLVVGLAGRQFDEYRATHGQ